MATTSFATQSFRNTSPLRVKLTSNLKDKLSSIEDTVKRLTGELNFHKRELQVLRAEKVTLESVVNMKF